ncbi:MAG: AbrB/MazE/SpoVT family DNA-binding domain-containing protein [Clostridia bacterium]|nr:AbrB/MazE/SpoVT family DNA-binding domain-containing protein [Clostridia bacterium]
MKDTGITRRIDELGRIVIPRELRKTLRIKEGEPLEFYSDGDRLIIKKYSPVASIEGVAKMVADGIAELAEKACIIVDNDQIVYATGNKLKDLIGKEISAELLSALSDRKSLILSKADGGEVLPLADDKTLDAENQLIVPIMAEGDVFGGVILFDCDKDSRFNCADVKFVKLGATFLAKQFE